MTNTNSGTCFIIVPIKYLQAGYKYNVVLFKTTSRILWFKYKSQYD
jgi:hypothetical protein